MQKLHVDDGQKLPAYRIDGCGTVGRACPDRHAPTLPRAGPEIARQSLPLPTAALRMRQSLFRNEKPVAARFEPGKLTPGGENVPCEYRDVAQRPCQKRRNDRLGDARGPVLGNMTIARDACGWPSVPRFERQAAGGKVLTVEIEVDDDLEKLPDNDGPPCRVLSEMPRIGVDQRRINAGKVQRAQSFADEGEEAPRPVERLPHTAGRQLRTMAGKVDIETRIEIGAHHCLHIGIFQHVKMHGDVAAPGVLAEDGRTQIPAWIADARQVLAGMARLERRARQHGPIVERGSASKGGRGHARASGGR